MTRSHKILGFLVVVFVSVYGCAKGPTGTGASDKNAAQGTKVQRLEEDYRAAAAARDQFKQKLLAAEERQAQLQKQLDQERAEVKARTAERDAVTSQYEGFRKSLRELLNQAEGVTTPSLSQSPPTGVGVNIAPMPAEAGLRN